MVPRAEVKFDGIISIKMYGNEVQFFTSLEELSEFIAPTQGKIAFK